MRGGSNCQEGTVDFELEHVYPVQEMGETRTARILVIDDEPTLARMITRMLRRQGWIIESVGSSEEAQRSIAAARYDVLIVDKNLPGMDGMELIDVVRRTDKAVGIIVVTGYATEESAMDAVDLGVDGYIEKPFRIQELAAIVELGLANSLRRGAIGANLAHAKQLARSVHAASVGGDQARILAAQAESNGWLTELDARVACVASNMEVPDHLAREAVELVLLDASLPGLIAIAQEVHTNFPHTGCIVVGPRPEFAVLRQLINLQVIAIIHPEDPTIVERINTLVTGRAPRATAPFPPS